MHTWIILIFTNAKKEKKKGSPHLVLPGGGVTGLPQLTKSAP